MVTVVPMATLVLILTLTQVLTLTSVIIGANGANGAIVAIGHQWITIVAIEALLSPLTPFSSLNGNPDRDITIEWHYCHHLDGTNGDQRQLQMLKKTIAIGADCDEMYH